MDLETTQLRDIIEKQILSKSKSKKALLHIDKSFNSLLVLILCKNLEKKNPDITISYRALPLENKDYEYFNTIKKCFCSDLQIINIGEYCNYFLQPFGLNEEITYFGEFDKMNLPNMMRLTYLDTIRSLNDMVFIGNADAVDICLRPCLLVNTFSPLQSKTKNDIFRIFENIVESLRKLGDQGNYINKEKIDVIESFKHQKYSAPFTRLDSFAKNLKIEDLRKSFNDDVIDKFIIGLKYY